MLQRLLKSIVALSLVLVFVLGDTIVASAASDISPPTIKSIQLDKTTVVPGDELLIQVEAEDLESGMSTGHGDRVVKVQKLEGSTNTSQYIYLSYNSITEKYEGKFLVPSNTINGIWYISWIYFVDKVGNIKSVFPKEGDNFYRQFTVNSGNDDITPPTIKNLTLNKTTVQPGDDLLFQVDVEDLESGISTTSTNRVLKVEKKVGSTTTDAYIYLNYNSVSKKYEGTYRVPSNTINGEWIVSWIHFVDKVGNVKSIFPKEGQEIYRQYTVINGNNDSTPPTIKSLNLDKTKVLPGENLKIQVAAEDLESGISTNGSNRIVKVEPLNGSTTTDKYINLYYNSETKQYEGTFNVSTNAVNAVWLVSWIYFVDQVGNIKSIYPKKGDNFYREFLISDDIIPPNKPTVNEVTDQSDSVSGTAEVSSLVTVKTGTTVIGTTKTTAEGQFSVPIPQQKAGTKLAITATDAGANTSEIKEVTVKDVTAPSVPNVNEVTENATSVNGTAEIASLITVKAGSTVLGTALTGSDRNFNVSIEKQKAGTKLTVTATDAAGNESEMKEVTVKDVTPPALPTVNEVTDQSVSVTGNAEAGSTIEVKSNTAVLGLAVTDATGNYTVNIVKQKAGTKLAVTATDISGNVSEMKEVTVKDATAPVVPSVNEVTDKSLTVTGVAEAGSSVQVKSNTTVLGSAVTDNAGNFSVTIVKQKAGTKLTVVATDLAGNVSEGREVKVKDVTAPSIPTVQEVTDQTVNLTGTSEVGSTIVVIAGSTVIGSEITTNDGKYTVQILKQKAGTKLTVTATDLAGNVSEGREVIVKDVTAPSIPTVNEVTDKSASVLGTAEVGSSVTVKAGTTILGSATSNIDGEYVVPIAKQVAGTILTITSTDSAGNSSEFAKMTVTKAAAEEASRIAGTSRYKTAVAISQEGWETAETVVLATGTDFPDALAGGPLAYKENAPILLTKPTSLLTETEEEIVRLGAKKVIILGSKGAVSLEVEAKLNSMGLAVERIGGKNRFDTAALIAKRLPSEQAVIAYGFNFPDVLSISPYAAKNGVPILLTRTDRVPGETVDAMIGRKKTIIVGSSGAISEAVMNQFPQPVRYGGKTRFDTGREIITNLPLGTEKAYVATGRNFPDALAGSVLAAKNNAPILLVNEKDIPIATKELVPNYDDFSIFGSNGAVDEVVVDELNQALKIK